LPLPLAENLPWQRIVGTRWTNSAAGAEIRTEPRYRSTILCIEWAAGGPPPVIEVTSRVMTRDRAIDWSRAATAPAPARLSAQQRRLYTGHDVALPGAEKTVPFLMYPQGERDGHWLDPLDPDAFRYAITVHEVSA
jgi:hypothetical protein